MVILIVKCLNQNSKCNIGNITLCSVFKRYHYNMIITILILDITIKLLICNRLLIRKMRKNIELLIMKFSFYF